PAPPPAEPPTPAPPAPPAPPTALPALLATLPNPETPLPVTVPLSWVVATTVLELVLKESDVVADAVLLLSAAALPAPEASAWLVLSRLLPRVELLSPMPASFCSWAMSWPEAPSTTRTAAVRMLCRMRIGMT